MIRSLLILAAIGSSAAQYAIQRNSNQAPDNMPAWYQMAKPSQAPSYAYERTNQYGLDRPQPQHTNSFTGYPPTYGARPGFPDMQGMAPAPSPRRFTGGADQKPYSSSIKRYHKLLLQKSSTAKTRTITTTETPMTDKPPKSLGNIYSTITPRSLERLNKDRMSWRKISPRPAPPSPVIETSGPTTTTTTTTTTMPSTTARFICNRIIDELLASTQRTIGPFRPVERTFKPRRLDYSTTLPTTTTTSKAPTLLEILWPNSELLAAIKDVVAKFKASLDETGLDEDVRLMGNQLRNTWHQLRTGVDRGVKAVKQSAEMSVRDFNYGPMNEQIGRLLEKAAADATEQKTLRD